MAKARVVREIGYIPGNAGAAVRYLDIEDIDEVRVVTDNKHPHNGHTQIVLKERGRGHHQIRYSMESIEEIKRAIKEAREL